MRSLPLVLKVMLSAVTFFYLGSTLFVIFWKALELSILGMGFINDVDFLLFWTTPFAIGITLVAGLSIVLLSRLSLRWSYTIAMLLGYISALLYILLPASMLGPWFAAQDTPLLFVLIAGGSSAMVATAGLASRERHENTLFEATFLLAVSGTLALVTLIFALLLGFFPEILNQYQLFSIATLAVTFLLCLVILLLGFRLLPLKRSVE